MSKSLLCHCAGICGFDHVRWDYSGQRKTTEVIRRSSGKFTCPSCGSSSVTATRVGSREILNGKLGADTWVLEVEMHRIRCHDCLAFRMERLPFLSSSLSRISKCLERSIMELRSDMSISAISNYFSVDWRTVKDVEKKNLKKKYASVSLSEVRVLGVDEIYVGKKKYKTVVRDLESGCVLHVGDGKGGEALDEFGKRLSRSKADVETIAMDMSSGFSSWFREKLPEAEIVFDHFHVIKLMNDKLEKIRRRIAGELDDDALSKLKKNASCF